MQRQALAVFMELQGPNDTATRMCQQNLEGSEFGLADPAAFHALRAGQAHNAGVERHRLPSEMLVFMDQSEL